MTGRKEKPSKHPFDGFSYILEDRLIKKTYFVHKTSCIYQTQLRNKSCRLPIFNTANGNSILVPPIRCGEWYCIARFPTNPFKNKYWTLILFS